MESRKTTPLPQDPVTLMNAVATVVTNPPKGFKPGAIQPQTYSAVMSCGMGLASWGEDIAIHVYSGANGGSILDIVSTPSLPTTVIDWGKGDKNCSKLTDAILSVLPR